MKLIMRIVLPLLLTSCLAATGLAQQSTNSTANTTTADSTVADDFFQKQDWTNAVKAYQAITAQEPNNGRAWYRLGMSYFSQGQFQPAAAALLKAEAIGHNPTVMYNLACAYARLNDKDNAFVWLNQTVQRGYRQVATLEADNDLASLRSDARFKVLLDQVRANAEPCTQIPEARQFDFWLGEWDVKSPQGQAAGQSSIQLILGKCVLLENWTSAGGSSGKSFNVFNTADRKWHQTWVDDQGSFTEYKDGEYKDGKLTFVAEQQRGGQKTLLRMTFTNLDAKRVRQFGETSNNGGQTWQVSFDLTYHRKSAGQAR